ncbi:hypothetical protein PAXRUDRAFT_425711 [Paxillus rubicundulus Ve08.2h10]|uniref:Uncharacterized protein n=1 Tax=Paxillus rubicundulus Ve08.2h10 TaxID=930991 RepID=A0A0D0DFK2_9AGAM|nr:hypothetical protein PAXRUDRAFT_425711 [Paxillus rubicundulus Ve08.2h10]
MLNVSRCMTVVSARSDVMMVILGHGEEFRVEWYRVGRVRLILSLSQPAKQTLFGDLSAMVPEHLTNLGWPVAPHDWTSNVLARRKT